ncbi:MAG: hypothetical protein LBR79_06355 [Oscillospiraceae bacterium]|nr:hypothetical protein [Oscillospiraceae bacterium]
MKLVLKSKRRGKFILKLFMLLFALYVVFLIISQNISIQRKKNKIISLNEQLSLQNSENENLSKELEPEEVI